MLRERKFLDMNRLQQVQRYDLKCGLLLRFPDNDKEDVCMEVPAPYPCRRESGLASIEAKVTKRNMGKQISPTPGQRVHYVS